MQIVHTFTVAIFLDDDDLHASQQFELGDLLARYAYNWLLDHNISSATAIWNHERQYLGNDLPKERE